MRRMTRHDYRQAASFERCEEAAYALADADAEDDTAYHRARARFRAAIQAREAAAVRAALDAKARKKQRTPAMQYPTLPF
jgi:hypothetical protein